MGKMPRIDVSDEPLAIRMLYPTDDFWLTHEEKRQERLDLIEARVPTETPTVVVHDTDADGLGAAVMAKAKTPDAALVPRHHSDDITIAEVGELLQQYLGEKGGKRVIITDNGLTVDEDEEPTEAVESYLRPYLSTFDEVFVYDHHQWPTEATDWMESNSGTGPITFTIDEDRCAAKIVYDEYTNADVTGARVDQAYEAPELEEFAKVTQDHDLWIKEDGRSDALADYSYAVDNQTYIEMALDHGVDLLHTEEVRKELMSARARKQEKLDYLLKRATFYEVNGKTLAVTYGRGPKSEVGSILYGEYGADVVCKMSPSGGLSFRSNDDESALALAKAFHGGGHNDAAGGFLRDTVVEGDIPYASYWGTMGEIVHDVLLERAEEVL